MQQAKIQCSIRDPAVRAVRTLPLDAGPNRFQLGGCLGFVYVVHPAFGQGHGRWRELESVALRPSPSKTAPAPVFCARYQASPQCIAFDVAHDCDQVIVLLDQERLEAALPYTTTGLILPMMTTHVRGEEPMGPAGQISVAVRAHDEVQMVRHEAEGQNRHREVLLRLDDERQKCSVVGRVVKNARVIVTSVDHVVAVSADDGTCRTGHTAKLAQVPGHDSSDKVRLREHLAVMRNVPISVVGT